MIKINFAAYRDKVNACWLGKNIGGTMGTPYESTREHLGDEMKNLLAETEFVVRAGDLVDAKNRIVLEVECDGRPTVLYCPVTLIG